jgi:uncharacterized membrane protein
MEPALGVALLWLLFGGLHIGLTVAPVRTRLHARLGEWGFILLFSLVASASFALLVRYYATHRWEGAAGLALGASAPLRWVLMTLAGVGVVLVTAGLVAYPRLPMAVMGGGIRAPRGIERITRHPFFVGTALIALIHVLLATRLVGAVFVGGFALLAIAGARHQDAKLLARRGRAYADYIAVTSTLPFRAMVAGRQQLPWHELPLGTLAAGVGVAAGLRALHDGLFGHGGAWVIAAVVGGGALATLQSWRYARRAAGWGRTRGQRDRARRSDGLST